MKYKESGRKEMSSSLFATLPDTVETSFAREMTELLSEVATRLDGGLTERQNPETRGWQKKVLDSLSQSYMMFSREQSGTSVSQSERG